MKRISTVFVSLIVAFCLTGSAAILTIVAMAFSHEEDEFTSTGLFDSVYFSSAINENNNLDIQFGINDPVRMGIVFLVILIVSFIIVRLFTTLLHRKEG